MAKKIDAEKINMELEDSNFPSKNPLFVKIEKFLKNDAKLLDELDASLAITESEPIRIAVCGLLKAGKSSLLNALTGHLDPEAELFPTGAVRTTVKKQEFSKQDFIFIDTPGLDATEEDDKKAWEGIKSSDILLFVHSLVVPPLDLDEVRLLTKIADNTHRGSLNERVVVILTHCEDYDEDVIKKIGESINIQIIEAIGCELRQFHTSFTSYRKGILKGEPQLAEWSQIPELIEHLFSNLADKHNAALAFRKEKVLVIRKKLLDALGAEIAQREERLTALRNEEKKKRDAFSKDAEMLVDALRKKIATYDRNYN